MSKQVIIEFPGEVPEEILQDPEVMKEARTVIILGMLRKGVIFQSKAAELLEIDQDMLLGLMTKYDIPVVKTAEQESTPELPPVEDPTSVTAGAWEGLLNCQEFEQEVYESRLYRTRPGVRL